MNKKIKKEEIKTLIFALQARIDYPEIFPELVFNLNVENKRLTTTQCSPIYIQSDYFKTIYHMRAEVYAYFGYSFKDGQEQPQDTRIKYIYMNGPGNQYNALDLYLSHRYSNRNKNISLFDFPTIAYLTLPSDTLLTELSPARRSLIHSTAIEHASADLTSMKKDRSSLKKYLVQKGDNASLSKLPPMDPFTADIALRKFTAFLLKLPMKFDARPLSFNYFMDHDYIAEQSRYFTLAKCLESFMSAFNIPMSSISVMKNLEKYPLAAAIAYIKDIASGLSNEMIYNFKNALDICNSVIVNHFKSGEREYTLNDFIDPFIPDPSNITSDSLEKCEEKILKELNPGGPSYVMNTESIYNEVYINNQNEIYDLGLSPYFPLFIDIYLILTTSKDIKPVPVPRYDSD